MRDFINAATNGTGGASLVGFTTGQGTLAVATFICMVIFGVWGAYIRWKDSRAFNEALKNGDLKRALELRK